MNNLEKMQTLSAGSNPYADCPTNVPWHTASGPLQFPMTNDYLFRSLLQSNNHVLKGLISALLHLDAGEIHSADILNPIELGKAIDDKTFILDIKVLFNDNTIVQLEMLIRPSNLSFRLASSTLLYFRNLLNFMRLINY